MTSSPNINPTLCSPTMSFTMAACTMQWRQSWVRWWPCLGRSIRKTFFRLNNGALQRKRPSKSMLLRYVILFIVSIISMRTNVAAVAAADTPWKVAETVSKTCDWKCWKHELKAGHIKCWNVNMFVRLWTKNDRRQHLLHYFENQYFCTNQIL